MARKQGGHPLSLAWLALALLDGMALGYAEATGTLIVPAVLLIPVGLGMCLVAGWVAQRRLFCLAVALLLLAGFLRGTGGAAALSEGDIGLFAARTVTVTGTVAAEPDIRDSATLVMVAVDTVQVPGGPAQSAHGLLQMRYGSRPAVEYGDVLKLSGRVQSLASSAGSGSSAYLRSKGVSATIGYPRLLRLAHGAGNPLWAAILRLRDRLEQAMDQMLPQPEASLLAALLLGGRSAALGEVKNAFVAAGMIHVVATSGLKIALVAGLANRLALWLLGIRRAYLATLLVVGTYVALTGATPAGVRAGVMWTLVLLAQRLGRRTHVLTSLALTAAGMAALDPSLLGDVGFQLTTVGTAGIALLADPLERRMHRLPRLLREGLAVTVAAQLATLPIVAGGFGQLSLISPLANAVCLPVMALAMTVGGAGAALTLIVPGLAQVAGWAVYPLLWVMVGIIKALAALPLAAFAVSGPDGLISLLYYGLLILAAWSVLPEVPRPAWIARFLPGTLTPARVGGGPASLPPRVAIGAGIVALLTTAGWQIPPIGLYRLTVLNTGNGQSIVLQTPAHQVVLIDGGNGAGTLRMALGALLPFWQRQLTLVLLTSTDHAHTAGLAGLTMTYRIGMAADAGSYYPHPDYAVWRAALRRAGVRHVQVRWGHRLVVDKNVLIDVLAPAEVDPDAPWPPVAYRLWLGKVTLLLLSPEALLLDQTAFRGDRSPAAGATPTRDTLVALPRIPQRGNPAWRLLTLQRPALVILPSLADATALGAQTAPLALPPGVTQSWQGAQGNRLDLWTDGQGYMVRPGP